MIKNEKKNISNSITNTFIINNLFLNKLDNISNVSLAKQKRFNNWLILMVRQPA